MARVRRTKSGAVLTPEQLEGLAREAEALVRSARAALRRAASTASLLDDSPERSPKGGPGG